MADFGEILARARHDEQPLVMGVLNLTPDSFYDGGRYVQPSDIRSRLEALRAQGADLVDIGAESSKPGAPPVPAATQLERLGDAIRIAWGLGCVVSIDTQSPEVARRGIEMGAQVVNDVSCLRDEGLAQVAAQTGSFLVLTHSRAPMDRMSGFSQWPDDDYTDIVEDVALDWGRARARACDAGLSSERILFDPGLGFSKNARHSFHLLAGLERFRKLGAAILVGPGRKSFISAADPSPPEERLGGTVAASLLAVQKGADIVRVHDVQEVRQALRVLKAVRNPELLRAE